MFTDTLPTAQLPTRPQTDTGSPTRETATSAPPAVEELTTTEALGALQPEWDQLWSRVPGATPFQSPRWLIPWWRHVGRGRLMTLTARSPDDRALVAILPLYVFTDRTSGCRHLFPIGIATTDYLDALCQPGFEQQVLGSAMTYLARRSDEWDILDFPQLRPTSSMLVGRPPEGYRHQVDESEPNPTLALHSPDADLPFPAIPPAMADNLRYYRRRAARAGAVTYDLADAATLPESLDALVRLHTRRWSDRGLPGVLNDQAVLAHHRYAAPQLLAGGLLRLYTLRIDGRPIAALYCLADPASRPEPRHYYYLGGFDPQLAPLSPGTLLVAHAIERAAAEGATAFDFLRGREAYKYRWGARDHPMYTLRLTPTPRGPSSDDGRP